MRPPSPEETQHLAVAGLAAGLGCSIVASVIVSIVGGLLLDRWLGTKPWLTLAGVAVALIAAGYQLYELSSIGRKGKELGPVSKGMSRVIKRERPAAGWGDDE